MPVTATGPISIPLSRLKTLLSKSTNFQTLVGVGTSAAALAFIDMVRKAAPDVATGHGLVSHAPAGRWRAERGQQGTSAAFDVTSGQLRLTIRKAITQTDAQDAELEFTNSLGAILTDLVNNSGAVANLQITAATLVSLSRSDPDQKNSQGEIYMGEVDLDWKGDLA